MIRSKPRPLSGRRNSSDGLLPMPASSIISSIRPSVSGFNEPLNTVFPFPANQVILARG